VDELISDPGKNVGAFYDHARVLARLDSLLTGFLSPDLATRFQVANLRQDLLILLTPSASLATRLRLQTSELLTFLHASGFRQVHNIDIHVAPLQKPQPEQKIRRQTSVAAREAAERINQLTNPSKAGPSKPLSSKG
jgi:hypothetical protein